MSDRPTPHEPAEARLRAALVAHAETIEPSRDGLERIEERLMTRSTSPTTRRWLLGGGAVAAALLLGAVAFVVTDEDDAGVATDSTSTTTTTVDPTTTTTTEAPFTTDVDPAAVAYPGPLTSQRFDSPDAVVANYARDVLGFTEFVQSDFREGDSRSGEVPVSDREGGPETVILVRQMEDDTWFVLGSVATDITVDSPEAGDGISSPFETSGQALAFEGTVEVIVRTQDDPTPIGEGFVTGSGVPPAGPFEGEIEFTPPPEATSGIIVYRTLSAEDGHVLQATSFPVQLQPA